MTEQTAQAQAAQASEATTTSLLDQIIDQGRLAREESQKPWAKDLIGEFVAQVMDGAMVVSKDMESMINTRISQIDKLISDQLNEVMHHESFKKLEGSWRGLHYLINKSETGERMKIRVMNVSKKDLIKDMEKASEYDQSSLIKQINDEENGSCGVGPRPLHRGNSPADVQHGELH